MCLFVSARDLNPLFKTQIMCWIGYFLYLKLPIIILGKTKLVDCVEIKVDVCWSFVFNYLSVVCFLVICWETIQKRVSVY